MAYDFYKNKRYTIDYDLIRGFVREHNIFNQRADENLYIESWVKLLKCSEKEANLEIEWLRKRNEFDIKFGRYEFFESEIPKLKLKIFWDIERIKEYSTKITNIKELNIEEYLNKRTNIFGNPKHSYDREIPSDSELSEAICVVPFLKVAYIIDGNHRLGYYISNNKESLKYKFISGEELVDNSFFLSKFDKYMYIFLNELAYLRVLIGRDKEKISKSFLCTGKYIGLN